MNTKRIIRRTLFVLILVFIAIQFIPVTRSNPAVTAPFDQPSEVLEIVSRSCFDCHSNETVWPWYSYVAPVSWLVAHDVNEGREHLNFSEWHSYMEEDIPVIKKEIWEEIEEGEMPLGIYLILHSDAKLSEADITVLHDWIRQ
jgi:hypothetical protein